MHAEAYLRSSAIATHGLYICQPTHGLNVPDDLCRCSPLYSKKPTGDHHQGEPKQLSSTRCCIVCLLNCLTAVTLCNSFSFVRVLYCTVNGNENTTLDKQLKQLKKQSEQHTSSATIVRVFLPRPTAVQHRTVVLQLPRTAEPDCRNLQKTFNPCVSRVQSMCSYS